MAIPLILVSLEFDFSHSLSFTRYVLNDVGRSFRSVLQES